MSRKTIAIIGVGLIGGSIGKAVRQHNLADRVIGVGRDQRRLDSAVALGIVDEASTDLVAVARQSDLIIVCTPVDTIVEFVQRVAEHCAQNTIITDVGSTKGSVVAGLDGQLANGTFIGSHPLAGGHETGFEHARSDLLQGKVVVVTPTEQTPVDAQDELAEFWQSLGALVEFRSPGQHDVDLAMTSHMPHVLASALAAATPEDALPLTASGWFDTTRVAMGDTNLWWQIIRDNRIAVLQALDGFERQLANYRAVLGADPPDQERFSHIWNEGKRKREAMEESLTLWQVDIFPAESQPDRDGSGVAGQANDLAIGEGLHVAAGGGFLLQGKLNQNQVERIARELLSDPVVETTVVRPVGHPDLAEPPMRFSQQAGEGPHLVHVLLKPGVMDPVAQSALNALEDFEFQVEVNAIRTLRKYWLTTESEAQLELLCGKLLANDAIEQVVRGPLEMERLELGADYRFELTHVRLLDLNDEQLQELSIQGQLYLSLTEMQTIQNHFKELSREPTDIELESVAQTWSEHCSHKTLAGRIAYRDERGEKRFENMLKETIFAATETIQESLGDDNWCVSVFKDNAGIVRFDDEYNVVFKVETHNHPSALEPYGGANTGIGGVIRDPLGTGMGARPICNTDVFCFAPPDTKMSELPPGVLHPRRVMRGVVSGVRDYGNRMGIPTVNGAVYFDPRYLGNPLVYCGNVGIIPKEMSHKEVKAGDWIVAIGGRTGRDGIHGATFSSAELTSESEELSGGAVQIGNAITEKMLLDVLLQTRDLGLYSAVTDCGAGGFSSAVGEMGEEIGAEVWLERAPLKYDGLSYTEIWISEAQERMVFSVPPQHWETFRNVCQAEGVEATIIGRFEPTNRLVLKYQDQVVGDLAMEFLHDGRPPVVREAVYQPPPVEALQQTDGSHPDVDLRETLRDILGSLNVASKEWVIRQYDHEVQGGSVVKPLVGVNNDGPSDAAVIRPRLDSYQGLAVSCGMNPHYGDFDTYHMAASAIDEAVRNCVAVGADPARIAILDNFCWGYTDRAETLGSLTRAALACQEVAIGLQTPFISGKDSLNNEFSFQDGSGDKQTTSIPPSLLISAMGLVPDVRRCVTMDLKEAGNRLILIGQTEEELGGSHFSLVRGFQGGQVPVVNINRAKLVFHALHRAIQNGLVRSCHDLSEGGLAVALAEMAFAGELGSDVDVSSIVESSNLSIPHAWVSLFAESNTRFLCEVPQAYVAQFRDTMADLPVYEIGVVADHSQLNIKGIGSDGQAVELIRADIAELKDCWQAPLAWS